MLALRRACVRVGVVAITVSALVALVAQAGNAHEQLFARWADWDRIGSATYGCTGAASGGGYAGSVQSMLYVSNNLPVPSDVDSVFGPRTHDAARAWQRFHSLVDDGCVGAMTLDKMQFGSHRVYDQPTHDYITYPHLEYIGDIPDGGRRFIFQEPELSDREVEYRECGEGYPYPPSYGRPTYYQSPNTRTFYLVDHDLGPGPNADCVKPVRTNSKTNFLLPNIGAGGGG